MTPRRGDMVRHKHAWVEVRAVRSHPIRYAELVGADGRRYTAPLSELETS